MQSLVVQSNYAYVGATAVEIVNVSDPAHPSRVATWSKYCGWGEVALKGTYLYVPNYIQDQGYRLVVVNVSNPANPNQS